MKRFSLSSFITSMILALLYPIAKAAISTNKALVLSDSMLIMGLLFTLFGIFNWLYLKGDFDLTVFIARKSFHRPSEKDYQTYEENQKEKRKSSFNYPLLTGMILLTISIILSFLV